MGLGFKSQYTHIFVIFMLLIQKLILQLYQTQQAKKQTLLFPKTTLLCKIIRKLTHEGFVYGYKPVTIQKPYKSDQKYINIYLKYYKKQGVISFLHKYSFISLFQKISYSQLLFLKHYAPVILLLTIKGVLTHQEAIKYRLGGRIIFISI